jgi:thiamine-phosphate pyrophosphorylase
MNHKIYALFDFELNQKKGYTLSEFLQLPKVKKATLLQYRDKINTNSVKKENLLFLKENFHGSVIVNDDISLLPYADGLHVGQEDVLHFDTHIEKAVKLLRERIGDKILGLSTHNETEISIANKLPLDYIGLGAYRITSTKNVSNILGEKVSSLAALSQHDVAVIGGVKSSDKIAYATYLVLGSDLYEN